MTLKLPMQGGQIPACALNFVQKTKPVMVFTKEQGRKVESGRENKKEDGTTLQKS